MPTPVPALFAFIAFAPLRAASAPLGQREPAPLGYPAPHEFYYQQLVDHFNPEDTRRWPQRYLLNRDSWDGRSRLANGCPGPVLFYTGNEGSIDDFWNVSGFVVETLAQRLGGLVVFAEQRYYGKSLPFGNEFTAENLAYLTTAQVLADHAEVIEHVKGSLAEAEHCPVVAFGGSYGGTLTALLRATYPTAVVGGLAASSELGYYDVPSWAAHGVDELTFEEIVIATWDAARPGCLRAVKATLAAIDAADTNQVVSALGACDEKALGPGPKSGFFAYVLEGMPQGDYASAGAPVTAACDELLAAEALVEAGDSEKRGESPLLEAAGKISKRFSGSSSCVAYYVGGPGNTPGDGPSLTAWGWQSSTEALHAFSARTLRNYSFSLETSATLVGQLYNHTVRPDLAALTTLFGSGYALADGRAGVTRLIWSQGTLDPWHGWFQNVSAAPAGLDVHHFIIEGAAHHEDLRAPFAGDRPSVAAARLKEEAIIRRWVSEASSTVYV